MSKHKTQAGRETWALICWIVAPALPPVTTKTAIKAVAYKTFGAGPDFPASRIDEAAQERNGWKTKAAFEARARELGLRLPEGHPGRESVTAGCGNDAEYIDRLRRQQRLAPPHEWQAYERYIEQVSGRLVAGPPIRS